MKYLVIGFLGLNLISCKNKVNFAGPNPDFTPKAQEVFRQPLDYVSHGKAYITIQNQQDSLYSKLFKQLLMPIAWASSTTINVTYVNAVANTFTVNTASLSAGSITGDYLSLGSLTLNGLDDNNLKDCGPSNNQKCTNAYIITYTTGATAGFIHDDDDYGLPVLGGHNNPSPTSEVGLGTSNALILQQLAIPNNKNRIRLSDFTTPTYNYRVDFGNGGTGSYSMTLVIEYGLSL